MTVAELIEQLQQVPPEKTVLVSQGTGTESTSDGPDEEVLRVSDEMVHVLLYYRRQP